MFEKPFKDWNPGIGQISTREINRQLRKIDRLGKFDVFPGMELVDNEAGVSILTDNYKTRVRITGGSGGVGGYSWEDVEPSNASYGKIPNWNNWFRSSDTTTFPAFERNGRTIAAGTIVNAEFMPALGIVLVDFDGGPGGGGDLNSFRRPNIRYTCPITGQATAGGICRSDEILAIPYNTPVAETIFSIGFCLDTAGQAGSLFRMAIYDTDPLTQDPAGLLFDSGDVACDGVDGGTWHDTTILPAITTVPGSLYYLAIQGNSLAYAGGGPSAAVFRWISQVMLYNFRGLGGDGDGTPKFWLSAPWTYGAYPAAFPVGGIVDEGGNAPIVAVKHN